MYLRISSLSPSASEKIAKPEESVEELTFLEVEYALIAVCLEPENFPLDPENKQRDPALFKWKQWDGTDLLVEFLTKDNISR